MARMIGNGFGLLALSALTSILLGATIGAGR
jgi:hypothetical protein